jgi:ABC-type dipeptide/oligopeptide/nickel transport system ATPase component
VQGELLNLLLDLQRDFGLTYLLVSHNLNVIRRVTERTAVMYLGQIVEDARTSELFAKPAHPYSAALLSTNPVVDPKKRAHPYRAAGRDSQRGESAQRMPLPYALPGGAARSARPTRRHCCRSPAEDAFAATFRSPSLRAANKSRRLPCLRSTSRTSTAPTSRRSP